MSNGEMLVALNKMIESGEKFTVRQYRLLTLSSHVELHTASQVRDDKIVEIEIQLRKTHPQCQEVIDLAEDVEQIQLVEIPNLRKASKITDAIVLAFTALLGYFGLKT